MALKANCNRLPGKRRDLAKTLLIMKFLAFFLLVTSLAASARGYAQGITISQKNVSLQTVLKEIEKQSGYRFFYNESLLQQVNKISVDVKNATLPDALEACLKGL